MRSARAMREEPVLPDVVSVDEAVLPPDDAVALPLDGIAAVEPVLPVPLLPMVLALPVVLPAEPEEPAVPAAAVVPVPAPAGPMPLAAWPEGWVLAERLLEPTLSDCIDDAPLFWLMPRCSAAWPDEGTPVAGPEP